MAIGFSTPEEFERMAKAVRANERAPRNGVKSTVRQPVFGDNGGKKIKWGKAKTTESAYDVVEVDVFRDLPLTGTDNDQILKCIAICPVILGVPGLILPVPSLRTDDGDDTIVLSFQPFVREYRCVAAADWTANSTFNVTVSTGPIASTQTVVALAPDIPGVGMSGVKGYIFPLFGGAADWQFVPLGCTPPTP